MISLIGRQFRRFRRRFSRTALVARLLGIDVLEQDGHARGLVILQLDGLSKRQFQAATQKRRLPFLRRMTHRRHFLEMSFYSGLPSTTPAVQAEVMYGVRGAVPAFEFLHRASGKVFRMFEQDCAKTVVDELRESGDPLLTDGCSYSNIYSGGASEARFCAETLDLENVLKMAGPTKLLIMLTIYIPTIVRTLGLVMVEVSVALFDVIRGLFERNDIRREMQCVMTRVMVGIVLREWLRIMVKLAVHQGRPVIYANFLGYDEQAHRRGPDSLFAHWSLKGIDRTFRDIFLSAHRSDARDYEIVVFSDHGQERTRIYRDEFGDSVAAAIQRTFAACSLQNRNVQPAQERQFHGHYQDQRMRHLMRVHRGRDKRPPLTAQQLSENVIVCAMGPIGHIYAPVPLSTANKRELARHLVDTEHVPLVVFRDDEENVLARNASGVWALPDDAAAVLGADHPFLEEATGDLIALAGNVNSGELIISGWSAGDEPLSFEVEMGAHGSFGSQETCGFALVPDALHVSPHRSEIVGDWIRGEDLHFAARRFLNDGSRLRASVSSPNLELPDDGLRVMTYNIHSAVGIDGKVSPERIARVIRHCRADIVALQEVDMNRPRTGCRQQAEVIAEALGMSHLFFPVYDESGEQYGLSVLSRFRIEEVQCRLLTQADDRQRREARGLMWVRIDTPVGSVNVLNTHLGLTRRERQRQIDEMLGPNCLAGIPDDEPIILCGDLNAGPRSEVVRRLSQRLTCVQTAANDHRPLGTFASVMPVRRIDYVLVTRQWQVEQIHIPRTPDARRASDHLPLCATLRLVPADSDSEQSTPQRATELRQPATPGVSEGPGGAS